jgi:putative CocE/NonD family hydrolase
MEMPDELMPGGLGRLWRQWLADHATDHFGLEAKHQEMDVPALTTTGWYDQQIGAIKNFTGLRENGMSERTRDNQYLIVGPWEHDETVWPSKLGPLDFGPQAHLDFYDISDQWFSRWLKDDENALDDWPRVRLFIMGRNEWRSADQWPLPETQYTEFYLHSGGEANDVDGDGVLSQIAPAAEPADRYSYDPRDPVMSIITMGAGHGPFDQRPLDGRRDILRFATVCLEQAVEVTGPVFLKLFAASSARDTDFTARLIDVRPDGFAQELCYGIVRARYRDSFEAPTLIAPGKVYEYHIEMNPTGNLFLPGHRIRVDISSSDFPNFDRNHNTGGDDYCESTLVTAQQTVFRDAARPSRIVLPVIPA